MSDRVALITGASSGIGLAVARALASNYLIVMSSSNAGRLSEAAESLQPDPSSRPLFCVPMDVTSTSSVAQAVQQVLEKFGRIDILVNSAGIGGGGVTTEFPEDQWHKIIDTNLNGTFRVTGEVIRRSGMSKRRWGRIVNIASTGGKQGVLHAAAYSASKHGVVGFSKSLGLELAKTGITVNAVCPGFVETALAVRARQGYAKLWHCTESDAKQRIEQRVPLGRYVDPDEVASLVVFLVSDEASAIVAQAMNICGGLGNY